MKTENSKGEMTQREKKNEILFVPTQQRLAALLSRYEDLSSRR